MDNLFIFSMSPLRLPSIFPPFSTISLYIHIYIYISLSLVLIYLSLFLVFFLPYFLFLPCVCLFVSLPCLFAFVSCKEQHQHIKLERFLINPFCFLFSCLALSFKSLFLNVACPYLKLCSFVNINACTFQKKKL